MVKIVRQPRYSIWLAHTIMPIGVGFLSRALYIGSDRQIRGFMIMTGAGVGMGFGPLGAHSNFHALMKLINFS